MTFTMESLNKEIKYVSISQNSDEKSTTVGLQDMSGSPGEVSENPVTKEGLENEL